MRRTRALLAGVGVLAAALLVPAGTADAATPAMSFTAHVSGKASTADVVQYAGSAHARSGTAVYVEQRSGSGAWSTVGVALIGGHGAYAGRFTSGTAGPAVLRARIHAGRSTPGAVSATRTVTLSTWFPLARLTPARPSHAVTATTVTADGIRYADSLDYNAYLAPGGRVTASWALAQRCSYLDASAVYTGIDRGMGEQGDAIVALEGDIVVKSVVAPDEPAIVARAALRGARTLTVTVAFDQEELHSDVSWLTPRILCSQDPPGT